MTNKRKEEIMKQVYVIYWSQSGNTQAMAEAVARGIESSGAAAVLTRVEDASVADLSDAAGFAMGCPAMGAEVLEESAMEPFVSEVEAICGGKSVALFGSYGWGDGQWMRDWVDRMSGSGATVLNGEGLICQEMPDADALAECEALGKQLAAL